METRIVAQGEEGQVYQHTAGSRFGRAITDTVNTGSKNPEVEGLIIEPSFSVAAIITCLFGDLQPKQVIPTIGGAGPLEVVSQGHKVARKATRW
jgi:hypothetical protein